MISREEQDLERCLKASVSENPGVLTTLALQVLLPMAVRLGVRYVLRKMSRGTSDANIEAAVGLVRGVIDRALAGKVG